MICIALLQFTSLRQHCDGGRIFSCGGLFRGSLFCWGDCLPPEMSRYKQNGKFNLNQGVEKIAQTTKVKTLMDKLVLSILKQTAS